ncbi:MAG: A/G-specific adenine glycosylase, partial [Alphaproteobacteria bacterium]
PYHILVSEVMLQQTTVATVKGYFSKFLERWPTIQDLAAASQDELMQCWQGLGYYSRARNLHKTAKIITDEHHGVIPNSYQSLIKLPGLGPYTAAAIASIAFKEPIIAIDTNVNRVLCRLFAISSEATMQKAHIQEVANALTHSNRSGEISQALMDIGSTLCKSKNPKCNDCFLKSDCLAYLQKLQNVLPLKPEKQTRPKRYGHSFVIRHETQVCIEKRPEKGLLANMYQFPTSEFLNEQTTPQYPFKATWKNIGTVHHIFTHFELELTLWETTVANTNNDLWCELSNLGNYGMPTMFKKALGYIRN